MLSMHPEVDDYTPEQRSEIDSLDAARVAEIDSQIVAALTPAWRKMSHVIGTVMGNIREPDQFVAERVRVLAATGALESRGNLARMHYCEVRAPHGHSSTMCTGSASV
jgi:hypothetical protein